MSYMKYKEIKRINAKKKTELSKNWHLAPSLKGKQHFFKDKIDLELTIDAISWASYFQKQEMATKLNS